jgi:anaerobic dimethyl sulfoxide reductase subunit C (anchor subunit)
MLAIFGFGMLLFMMSKILNWPDTASKIFIIFSMLSGVGLILSMIGIYLIPTVPSWNHFNTPVSFFGSALIFGSIGIMLFIYISKTGEPDSGILKHVLIFMIVIMGILILSSSFHQYLLSGFTFSGIEQINFSKGAFFIVFIVRMIVMVVVLFGLLYLLNMVSNPAFVFEHVKALLFLVTVLIIIEEVMGRYQFYWSYFRVGV